jgi:hypothetical protein
MAAAMRTRSSSTTRLLLVLLTALLVTPAIARAQEAVEYYATDALGSVRVVFNASVQVVARSDYLPFGEEVGVTGNLPTQRFIGPQWDEAGGFDFFNARSLQTRTGGSVAWPRYSTHCSCRRPGTATPTRSTAGS